MPNTEVVEVPIGKVKPNPLNPRKKLSDIPALAESVKRVGLINPIVVRKLGDEYVVVSGHRRLAAVKHIKSTTIACRVVEATDAVELESMIAENTVRQDLTTLEQADAVQALVGLELSDEEIAAALAMEADTVTAARTIKPEHRKALDKLANSGQLTLAGAAAYSEFKDAPVDEWARQRLTHWIENGDDGELAHTVATIRQELARNATLKSLRDGAVERGLAEIQFRSWEGPPLTTEPIVNLLQVGKKLTASQHAECPGRCFYVDDERTAPKLVECCADFVTHGHTKVAKPTITWYGRDGKKTTGASKGAVPNEAEREKQTAERRRVIANNKAWKPAVDVRSEWLTPYIARKTVSTKAKVFVLSTLADDPRAISTLATVRQDGWTVPTSPTTEGDHWRCALAQVVTFVEHEVLRTSTWRPGHYAKLAKRYFDFLAGEGYTLSDVEKVAGNGKGR